jgi:FAD/FMN-containing dehydrogenase/Fe-S oxidoreductase
MNTSKAYKKQATCNSFLHFFPIDCLFVKGSLYFCTLKKKSTLIFQLFNMISNTTWTALAESLAGELYTDETNRRLYATDGSHYREIPQAVALPKTEQDIQTLILFAQKHKTSLIPRTAGTSLAGQVVGGGIVVDVSKHFTNILEINKEEGWVRVQPAVVRDELNMALKVFGLFFGPETSTANRAMMGGMIGNNSCGSNSIIYGSTRDHLLEVRGFLSDGSEVVFKELSLPEYEAKLQQTQTLEGKIYQQLHAILQNPDNQAEIEKNFPKKEIPRRNTGYALDLLKIPHLPKVEQNNIQEVTIGMQEVTIGTQEVTIGTQEVTIGTQEVTIGTQEVTIGTQENNNTFNICKLIAGSEGTLCFMTEAKLHVNPLPPAEKALICGHYDSIINSLHANLIALKHNPSACELIDHYILECTEGNIEQSKNRFFVEGEPKAILVVEIARDTKEEVDAVVGKLVGELQTSGLGYTFPVLRGEDMAKVWSLRKAGLGVLGNMKGSAKPAEVVEDTAVTVEDLPAYIADYHKILEELGLKSVHYAHAGTGEIHLKPILDMKTAEGQRQYRAIAEAVARLVKRYGGSLSGEHGDGRLRGEFIPMMVGEKNYALMIRVKEVFDQNYVFNPNKIVKTPPMDKFLRHEGEHHTHEPHTIFDFSEAGGFIALAEKCTGSADCRKTEKTGGTMCPSYMATKNERDSTRARANILREMLGEGKNGFTGGQVNGLSGDEAVKEVLDLCLSCKGCTSECPSGVDMAKLKAEFMQHYYDKHGVPFRTHLIANYTKYNRLASILPAVYNFVFTNPFTSKIAKKITGFAQKRSIPLLYKTTLRNWWKKNEVKTKKVQVSNLSPVYLFCDEFTNYNDTEIGIKAVELLQRLGYEVRMINHEESGRAYLSKGLVREAQKIAIQNVHIFKDLITAETPLVGIEPSAILGFRDEYPALVGKELKADAERIAKNALTFEEFIAREIDKGNINSAQFTKEKRLIKVHGHCHQKALSSMTPTKKMLTLPAGYEVHMINSGCCGMAGSFGYEAEHYDLSMQVGELVLFPAVRNQPENVIICASGTSCRHQIKDGTGRQAKHPIEILWEALV